jgi:uncharacterized membrane protein YphA (DoxX/SURF4 family)
MKILLGIARFITGVLFIFSGLIKANDPTGLSYKMQEFFEVWGVPQFNSWTMGLSVLIIAFEIIAGVAVLLGWRFSLFSWLLLLLIAFFTFLTGYAVLSGKIHECGCLGDCIKMTAEMSFYKDLVLLVLILFIFSQRKKVKPFFSTSVSLSLMVLTVGFSFWFQYHTLKHLPVVDCLAYKVGNNLPELMKAPAGSIPDSTTINFVYEKQGREVEFDADHFPADFSDSLYTFRKRYDKLVRKGNAEPPVKDFIILSGTGADTTQSLLSAPGYSLMLFGQSLFPHGDLATWGKALKEISMKAKGEGVPLYVIAAQEGTATEALKRAGVDAPVFRGDAVAIKTAARANPVIFLMKGGTVMGKWAHADFPQVLDALDKIRQ